VIFAVIIIVTISIFEAIALGETMIDISDDEVKRFQMLARQNVKKNNTIKCDAQ